MAIDFPNSPNVNDTYTVDDKTFIWTGDYWRVLNSPNYISTLIKDADNDTKVEVEQSADEDTVRITTGGTERYSIGTDGHIIPTANEAYDLGSASNRFRDLYLSGSSIDLGGVSITSDGTNLALPPISSVSGDFTVDTDTLHVDSTNNRVGIGTTSPARTLEVQSSSGAVANFGSAVSNAYITFTDSGTTSNTHVRVGSAGDEMRFYAGDAERVRIDSSGNVGIGTTSPSADLHIADTSTILHLQDTDGTVGGSMSSMIQFTDSTGAVQSQVGLGTGTGYFVVDNNDGPMRVGTASADSLYLRTNNANQLTIDATGNVGINDTTPSYKLDVNGTVRATSGFVGNASTASALATARTISLTGDVTGSTTFNGSANVSISATVGDNSHNHTGFNGLSINSANGGSTFYVTRGGGTNESIGIYVLDRDGFIFMNQDETSGASYIHIDNNGAAGSTKRTYFNCNIHVPSVVKSGTSNFQIDHPLPEMNESHWLIHTGIEGPNADNLYRGTAVLVDGTASVNLDTEARMTEGTFVALNRRVQCYTTNETDWGAVKGSVDGNILTITAQDTTSTATVSWMVIGERKDQSIYDSDRSDSDGRALVEMEQDDPSIAPRTFEQAQEEALEAN